jgi:hypothetical protein
MDDQNTNPTEPTKDDARQSFTGKTLTTAQLDVAWSIAGIMKRGIDKSATFHEPLMDYSHSFSRTENIFKERYAQTMNQMREGLLEREANLGPDAKQEAHEYALRVLDDIQQGETMPFYAAFDRQAQPMAETFEISEVAAKKSIKAAFAEADGRDLYEVGKAVEKEHHLPKRDAERALKRAKSKDRSMSMQR